MAKASATRIAVVQAADLRPALCARLRRLTAPRGLMRNHLAFALEGHDAHVVAAWIGDRLVGWAIALHHRLYPPGSYELGVYVHHDFRRRRIGARLLARLIEQDPAGRYACQCHDAASTALYGPYDSFMKRTH